MTTEGIILGVSLTLTTTGIALLIYLGKRNGYLTFLGLAHWVSLGLLIIAGIITWVAMTWMTSPKGFKVNSKQWVALGASIFISVLWWARYAYIISDDVEAAEELEGS